MTTNHPERLDPALIRPGRINKRILMGYLQPADALAMVEHYFGATTAAQRASFHAAFTPNVFTPAQVEQLCAEVRALPRPPAPPARRDAPTRRATATRAHLWGRDCARAAGRAQFDTVDQLLGGLATLTPNQY